LFSKIFGWLNNVNSGISSVRYSCLNLLGFVVLSGTHETQEKVFFLDEDMSTFSMLRFSRRVIKTLGTILRNTNALLSLMNSRCERENIKLAIISSSLLLFPNVEQVSGVILSGILFVLR